MVPSDPSERSVEGLRSGIDPIDREWGGFYRGGAYLVYGRAASGRGLLTMRFAATGLELGERCLFVASERIRDLAVEASSIGLDLRRAQQAGSIHVTRVPPLVNLQQDGDEAVAKALTDLVALVRRERPDRVVVNDFLPFVMFRSFERFKRAFVEALEALDPIPSTLLVALPEPANEQSRRVIGFVASKMTGVAHIEPLDYDPASPERRLTLTPQVGHFGETVVCRWDLSALVRLPSETAGVPPLFARPGTAPERKGAVEAAPPEPPDFPEPPPPPVPTMPAPADEPEAWSPEAPEPEAGEPASPEATSEADAGSAEADTDREAFRIRLDAALARRGPGAPSFLLLAMRLDRSEGGAGPFDFEFVIDLVRASLRPQDAVLIDAEAERLVVWLEDSTADDAQDFFSRIRRSLESEAPRRADQLLHAVSAIVVPDGRPFQTAGEFLRYALDEDES